MRVDFWKGNQRPRQAGGLWSFFSDAGKCHAVRIVHVLFLARKTGAAMRHISIKFARFALAALVLYGPTTQANEVEIATYFGSCDASAASALDATHFVVGSDERDTLFVYQRGEPTAVGSVDLSGFLGTKNGEESDIEAAAAIGPRIYWITSHGRSRKKSKVRSSRHRFFATDPVGCQPPSVKPVGKPYTELLRDMEKSNVLKGYALGDAARLPAEADGGLNIEGLAGTPEGGLLIGFRNPLPHQRALIVPFLNPAEVIAGNRARFGQAVELDLGQRGIRSIEQVGKGYVIVAGPTADVGSFALFKWSGNPKEAAIQLMGIDLKDLRPEALFLVAGEKMQLLSDDGGLVVRGIECKKLSIDNQTFRSLDVSR